MRRGKTYQVMNEGQLRGYLCKSAFTALFSPHRNKLHPYSYVGQDHTTQPYLLHYNLLPYSLTFFYKLPPSTHHYNPPTQIQPTTSNPPCRSTAPRPPCPKPTTTRFTNHYPGATRSNSPSTSRSVKTQTKTHDSTSYILDLLFSASSAWRPNHQHTEKESGRREQEAKLSFLYSSKWVRMNIYILEYIFLTIFTFVGFIISYN